MEHPYPLIEFESEVGNDGAIRMPLPVLRQFGTGGRVTVRVTKGTVASKLRDRNVTEAEIENISICQLERRENVVEFLHAEGELRGKEGFARRAAALWKKQR